ncbi:MAG: ParA family protein [Cellulomonas sp.]
MLSLVGIAGVFVGYVVVLAIGSCPDAKARPVVLNVRDKLDVVPGGPEVADLGGLMYSRAARGGATLAAALHTSLARLADDYDLILIDTPPGRRPSSRPRSASPPPY